VPNIIQFRLYLFDKVITETKQFHFFMVHSVHCLVGLFRGNVFWCCFSYMFLTINGTE